VLTFWKIYCWSSAGNLVNHTFNNAFYFWRRGFFCPFLFSENITSTPEVLYSVLKLQRLVDIEISNISGITLWICAKKSIIYVTVRSFGMCRHVVWQFYRQSGERIARTLRVKYGVGSSETSVYLYQATWCHITKYHNLDLQANLKNKANKIYT